MEPLDPNPEIRYALYTVLQDLNVLEIIYHENLLYCRFLRIGNELIPSRENFEPELTGLHGRGRGAVA
jgi:hypothetical protein